MECGFCGGSSFKLIRRKNGDRRYCYTCFFAGWDAAKRGRLSPGVDPKGEKNSLSGGS